MTSLFAGHVASADALSPPAQPLSSTNAQQELHTLYIVQAADLASARDAVLAVGGVVTRELGIINAVGARLTPEALAALQKRADIRTLADGAMATSAAKSTAKTSDTTTTTSSFTTMLATLETERPPNAAFPKLIEADRAAAGGIRGAGVTVAVLDTGLTAIDGLWRDSNGANRVLAGFDAINAIPMMAVSDGNGHGTHVTGIIMNSDTATDGTQTGVAPDAKLVFVRAFDKNGSGTYLNVITGLNWVLNNRVKYGIRVLNLSFSAAPRSHYWDDPVNQAVMKLWQAGVVVVASAGNDGPTPMTIGVPGNTPYIVTVGAMTDNYTASTSDDRLASFSSAGPTHEGFVKPDLVAPVGHISSIMPSMSASIAIAHPEFQILENYFRMSGTSQSTAVVSGVVALMLQAKPWLTPDDVKCQLMASARQSVTSKGALAYSIFQQGAGLVNARAAVASTEQACANRGLDIDADVADRAHFGGLAQQDSAGNYYASGISGTGWAGHLTWSSGSLWSRTTLDGASVWSSGFLWSNGYLWSRSLPFDSASMESSGYLWSRSLVEPAAINRWVGQE